MDEPKILQQDGHEKVRKRNRQHVATHEDKLRVMKWMVAEEAKLKQEAEAKRAMTTTDVGDHPISNCLKPKQERLCISTRAIAEFPEVFCAASNQANYMKSMRWWKEAKTYIATTEGVIPPTKKARVGRGRRANGWTTWLYAELKQAMDKHYLEDPTPWTSRDLVLVGKSIVEASTHPIYNKDYMDPKRPGLSLSQNVNLRWVHGFKDKFQIRTGNRRQLSAAGEARLYQWILNCHNTKGNSNNCLVPKSEVFAQAHLLMAVSHDNEEWFKSFCQRYPDVLSLIQLAWEGPVKVEDTKTSITSNPHVNDGDDDGEGSFMGSNGPDNENVPTTINNSHTTSAVPSAMVVSSTTSSPALLEVHFYRLSSTHIALLWINNNTQRETLCVLFVAADAWRSNSANAQRDSHGGIPNSESAATTRHVTRSQRRCTYADVHPYYPDLSNAMTDASYIYIYICITATTCNISYVSKT
jgi:hypothetical protein